MGACFQARTFSGKKTAETVLKEFAKLQDQARYEHGHDGYSGSICELGHPAVATNVFDNFRAFEKHCENRYKGEALMARIKVIDLSKSKRYATAEAKARTQDNVPYQLHREGKVLTAKQREALALKSTKAWQKVREMEAAAAAKSTKMDWIVGGWCSS